MLYNIYIYYPLVIKHSWKLIHLRTIFPAKHTMDLAQDGNISLVSLLRWYNKHTHQVPGALAGVGKCPFLGILNITFKYLLEIISPILG